MGRSIVLKISYILLIDALNTSSPYKHKRVGKKLIKKDNLGRKTYGLCSYDIL